MEEACDSESLKHAAVAARAFRAGAPAALAQALAKLLTSAAGDHVLGISRARDWRACTAGCWNAARVVVRANRLGHPGRSRCRRSRGRFYRVAGKCPRPHRA